MGVTVPQLRRLVGNPHAYALQEADGSYRPVRAPLSNRVLQTHLDGVATVGTYIIKPPNQARTLVVDVDTGSPDQAFDVMQALLDLGLTMSEVGVEPSGMKGAHVWVVAADYVDAALLRALGLAAIALVGEQHEVFPKQTEVKDLGNLVKLPGGVHRVTGNRTEFIEGFPTPLDPSRLKELVGALPSVASYGKGEAPEPFKCMAEIQAGLGEGQRNIGLFHFATMLRRAGLTDESLAMVVHQVNLQFKPPLDEAEVENLLESSKTSGPLCRTLEGTDLHCGDACIVRRGSLGCRRGQIRMAAPGENVVVQIKNRDGRVVELRHPDGEGTMNV